VKQNNSAISIRDLSFSYEPGVSCFMEGLSLEIEQGSVCALLGPNGSGKTTLLLLILGMLRPVKGGLEICSGSLKGKQRVPKHLVGLVPQEESVAFGLSVSEYVLLGRAPHLGLFEQPGEADKELAARALEMVGILDLKDRAVPSLSGGERQLAMVARVLVQESHIMLLDEPTSHLDLGNTRRILDLMRLLKQSSKTVVFSTHDPNAAAAIADHVILMKKGKILSSGSPADTLTPEYLSMLYGVNVEVARVNGRPLVVID
jgi:iron complex transport system ATP-binding protein